MNRYVNLLLGAALATCLGAPCSALDPSAEELYLRGRKFEKKGKFAEAYLLYAEAAAADPKSKKYWNHAQALRTKAVVEANVMPAASSESEPSTPTLPEEQDSSESPEDADLDRTPPTAEDLVQARRPKPPTELKASEGPKSFEIHSADSKAVWEQVAKAYGMDCVFDGDYQAIPKVRFVLEGASYSEAFYALMAATNSFIVPIHEKLFMVVRDTPQKRTEIENTESVAIEIPDPVPLTDAQELVRSVQQVMEIQKLSIDSAHRIVFIRDRISKLHPAEILIRQLLGNRAQIAIDVDFYTVTKSNSLSFGIPIPSSQSILNLGSLPGLATTAQTLTGKILTFGGGSTLLGVSIASVELAANMTKSQTSSLMQTQLLSVDGQAATLHIGDRYPLLTSGYQFGAPAGTKASDLPVPSFSFEDLGLVLKITPKVHGMDELSLNMDAEMKSLGSQNFNGIPVVSARKFTQSVRLRFGEAAVVTGLVTRQQTLTLAGLAGLSSVPVLGPLFSHTTRDKLDTNVLIVIRPRLLSTPSTEIVTFPIAVGTETKPKTPL